jgi:ATP:corrinoid adenosyltransferase
VKQGRFRLERLDELTKQLRAGALDNDATTDVIEELEQLRGLSRAGIDMYECERGMLEPFDSGTVGGRSYDELDAMVKQERSKLDQLDELTKQLQNGSLDSDVIAGIIEALEERKADYRVWLDECEKAKFALSEPIELPEA